MKLPTPPGEIDLDKLEAAARKIASSWHAYSSQQYIAFHAAANPAVVLALVEEVRRLREEVDCLSRGFNDLNAQLCNAARREG